jgi:HSP20 family molecular chaperone IbpA
MSDPYSGTDLFGEFDRLQQQIAGLFGSLPSSVRSGRFGAFPQVNIGTTDDSIEIVAFASGINPAELDPSALCNSIVTGAPTGIWISLADAKLRAGSGASL